MSLPRKVQRQLTKFRLSAHNLEIDRGRQNDIQKEDRLCKLCERNYNKEEVENEYHFRLECSFYKDIRAKFNCMSIDKTRYNFRNLLTCTDESHLRSLEFYMCTCFALRRDYVDL